MSSQTIQYNFNIVGNANEVISAYSRPFETLEYVQCLRHVFVERFQGIASVIQNMQNVFGGITQAGHSPKCDRTSISPKVVYSLVATCGTS